MGMTIYDKKILIISYDMIPHATTWGGAQRMFFLANQLSMDGNEVTIYSCKKNKINDYGKKTNFNIIHKSIKNKIINSFFSKNNELKKSRKNPNIFINCINFMRKLLKSNNILSKALKRIDKYLYNEPTFLTGITAKKWVKENRREIVEFINQQEIRNVIVTAPPFGIFDIVRYIKSSCLGVNIITDYRDPWNLWSKQSSWIFNREKKLLRISDFITCTNEKIANDMSELFKLPLTKFLVIANGFDMASWEKTQVLDITNEQFTISYVGSISIGKQMIGSFRDLTNFFSAVKILIDEGTDIQIKIIGAENVDSDYENKLINMLNRKIIFIPPVDTTISFEHMLQSSVLLTIHTTHDDSAKYLVSAKLYDYIKSEKWVLSIGNEYSIQGDLVEKLGVGVHCQNEVESIKSAIMKLHQFWKEMKQQNFFDRGIYSREKQNLKIYEILK